MELVGWLVGQPVTKSVSQSFSQSVSHGFWFWGKSWHGLCASAVLPNFNSGIKNFKLLHSWTES